MNPKGLKVLMIVSDRSVLTPGSASAERLSWYGTLVDELHVVLLCDKAHGLQEGKAGENVWICPTNSINRFIRPFDGARLGKKIVSEKSFVRGRSLITTQDPFECGWAGIQVKKAWRIPLEAQLHTDPTSPYFSGFLNIIRKHIAKRVIRKANLIRVVSKSVGDKIAEMFHIDPSIISVLPIYIDAQQIQTAPVSFDLRSRYGWNFVLLVVTRLSREKNLAMALRVMSKVHEYFPKIGLVIVGSGPEESHLISLAHSLGIADHVVFAGWQDAPGSYYKTADLFLQTSVFEGYGMALVEAGLCGLPIVSTPVGVANELKDGKDLIICPQNDVDFMFKAVYDLVKDDTARTTLRHNIQQAVQSLLFSKEQYIERVRTNWQKTATSVL